MSLVVLLRGVNVGGHKTFRPALLAKKLKQYDVVNIGAAGTFVVRKRVAQSAVRKAFLKQLPFETKIIIRPGRDFLDLLSDDPFGGKKPASDIVRFVSVLGATPRTEPSYPVVLPAKGPWLLKLVGRRGRFVFGMYRRHMKVIQYLGSTDRMFDVPVTTRNWNTVGAIAEVLRYGS